MVVVLFSCSKEEKVFNNSLTPYSPTPVSTSDIFPMEFGAPNLPKDNPFTEEGIFLGRMLFYDPILSLDSSVSCASCHQQQYAFAEPLDRSFGIFGLRTSRSAMPLFNLAYSQKFFWDARVSSLRQLVFEPIVAHNEMAMSLTRLEERLKRNKKYIEYFNKAFNEEPNLYDMSLAMEQFLLSMVSKDSRFNRFFPGDNVQELNASELRGAFIFNGLVNLTPMGIPKVLIASIVMEAKWHSSKTQQWVESPTMV